MDVAGDHFLARTALAGEQHGGIAGRHPSRHGAGFQALCGAGDGCIRIVVATQTLLAHTAGARQAIEALQQRLHVEALAQVVHGAVAHGLHGPLNGTVSRHHDDGQLGVFLADPSQQFMTVHVRHLYVREHHVHRRRAKSGKGLPAIGNTAHGDPRFHQGGLQRLAQGRIVLHHEHVHAARTACALTFLLERYGISQHG